MIFQSKIGSAAVLVGGLLISTTAFAAPGDDDVASASRLRQPASAGQKSNVTMRGSTTWEPINNNLATRLEFVEPKVNITAEYPPGGSSFGIRNLIEGTCVLRGITDPAVCDVNGDGEVKVNDLLDGSGPGFVPDIAQSSRAIKASEVAVAAAAGLDLRGFNMAIDGLAIIVNATNPLAADPVGLSQPDVFSMYMASPTPEWGNFGVSAWADCPTREIHVYSRTSEGGTFGSFVDNWIAPSGGSESQLSARLGFELIAVETALEGVAAVADDACGVFYAGIGDWISEPAVAPVAAYENIPPGVVPSFDSIIDGSYAFSRTMWMYWIGDTEPNSPVDRVLNFVLSPYGQSIIGESGFVPAYRFLDYSKQSADILATMPAPDAQDMHQ